MRISKNINTESFRFNFLLIYVYSAFISILIVVFLFIYLKGIIATNNFYINVAQPMVYQAQMSNVDINRHASYVQSYTQFGNTEHKAKADERLFEKLPARLTDIVELSQKFEHDPEFHRLAKDLEDQFINILKTYKQFDDPEVDQAELLETTYLPMLIKYGLDMKLINNHHFDNYGDDLVNIFNQIDKYKFPALGILILLFCILGLAINRTSQKIKKGIEKLRKTIYTISSGDIPEKIEKSDNELVRIELALISLVENLKNVRLFAQEVGEGKFDSELSVFDNKGDLGTSLTQMKDSLRQIAEEGKLREWTNTGLAKFATIIQENSHDLTLLNECFITEIVKYTSSIQGGMFLTNYEDESNVFLELASCYAYDRTKFLNKTLAPGEGYIGQVYLEQKTRVLKDVPGNYINITSGLGNANPRNLVIQPMIANDKVEGVLELASFNEYQEHILSFIQLVSESVAASLSTAKTSASMGKIIRETKELTEQLQSQEEELRQNTEELQATQEDMERRVRELEEENRELKEKVGPVEV